MGNRKDGRPDQVRESECEIDVDIGTELSHLTKTDRQKQTRKSRRNIPACGGSYQLCHWTKWRKAGEIGHVIFRWTAHFSGINMEVSPFKKSIRVCLDLLSHSLVLYWI